MLNDINVAPECQLTPVKHNRLSTETHQTHNMPRFVACATFAVDFTLCPTFLITHNFLQYYAYATWTAANK